MKILEQSEKGSCFVVSDSETKPVLDITRDDLFRMMENVYTNKDFYEIEDSLLEIEQIKNPIEKEIAKQIVDKIKEFQSQADTIKSRLDAQYPEV